MKIYCEICRGSGAKVAKNTFINTDELFNIVYEQCEECNGMGYRELTSKDALLILHENCNKLESCQLCSIRWSCDKDFFNSPMHWSL